MTKEELEIQSDLQSQIIGMLGVYPELYNSFTLSAEYFSEPYHSMIKAMIASLKQHNALVLEYMMKEKWFDANKYLACCEACTSSNVKQFIRYQSLVVDKYKVRMVDVYSKELSNGDITLDEFNRKYQALMQLGIKQGNRLTASVLMDSCANSNKSIWFSKFNKLGGALKLKEHDFVVLAGGTGVGKSGYACNLALDLANYYKIVIFNLEMVPEELHQRFVSIKSGLTLDSLNKFKSLSKDEHNIAAEAINYIAQKHISIVDGSQTIDSLRSYIASHTSSDKHTVIFIDHIGLIGSTARTTYERATEVAKELRKISLDYNCTIIGLCQLNRDATRNHSRPNLAMLRDSGEIEQSASKVIFVWEHESDYWSIIEKNRSGIKCKIAVDYDKTTQIFFESADQRK